VVLTSLAEERRLANCFGSSSLTRFVCASIATASIGSDGIVGDNLDRYHKWSKKLGETERADYTKLLNLVGETKLRGLLDHVRKYGSAGLPAVSLLALGLGQELPEEGGAPL